jgi:hypothetical protein
MVQGTVYLVVEEGEDAIGSDSIWRTHELPAIIRSQEVDEILEVRPANIGEALEGSRPLVLLGYRENFLCSLSISNLHYSNTFVYR